MSTISQNNTPDPKTQVDPTTSPVGFQSGNAANTTAVLALIAALMQLFSDKNTMYATQSEAASSMADSLSNTEQELGTQQMIENVGLGSTDAAGGIGIAYAEVQNQREEQALQPLKDDYEGSQGFLNNLSHNPDQSVVDEESVTPETKERIEEIINKIKSGEIPLSNNGKPASLSSEDQSVVDTLSKPKFDEFKESVKEQVDTKGKQLAEARGTLEANRSKRKSWSDSFKTVSEGGGKINAGIMKEQQGETQADKTQYDATQKQFQSLQNETEKQADQDLQTALSLTQLIPELDKSNGAILST